MKKLTKNQQEVFNYIKWYKEKWETSPTYREICDNFGWSSVNAARAHVDYIIKKGHLTKVKKGSYIVNEKES